MIVLKIPGIPPTTNNAYVNKSSGHGRALSKEGERYKKYVGLHILQQLLLARKTVPKDKELSVVFVLGFQTHTKKGGAVIPKKRVCKNGVVKVIPEHKVSLFKKVDVSNRIKLLEDVLSEVTGIDDSQTFRLLVVKKQSEQEYTHIGIWWDNDDLLKGILDVLV